jgi:hypothetical protein
MSSACERDGWMQREIYPNENVDGGGGRCAQLSPPAGNQTFAGDAERPIYWPVVNELNPLEGVRCWYYYDYTRRAESYGVSCVYMRRDATCEQSLAELISLARKMAHTEARNLWLKTLPPLLPVYLAWPFIAIAAVTDTYGWHQTVWVLCRVRLMCAYIDAALSFNTTLTLLHFSALTAQNTITFWCWHVAQSFFTNMSRIYSFAWSYAL